MSGGVRGGEEGVAKGEIDARHCLRSPAAVTGSSRTNRTAVIVHVHQYRDGDAKTTVEEGGEVVSQDTQEYFAADELGPDEGWNQFEHGDRVIQRRGVTYEGVTSVSLPEELGEGDDLPGMDVQLVVEGGNEFVENARVVEVTESPS
jgi:hypothetical protein